MAMLERIEPGDSRAANRLLPLVYDELRRLAASKLAGEHPGQTLQATALVHEAWLQLVGDGGKMWQNRRHFFGAAAVAMRQILIVNARRKSTLKRGGDHNRVDIGELEITAATPDEHILLVDEALQELEKDDPEMARMVVLKFFGGLTNEEVAESLAVSLRTVNRQWLYAKIKLFRWIREQQ